ncbi:MAG: bifunctional tetrahydrofolate synthase/dihydrofolate synthase [Gammaproteobacteria bacterium]|jgi:dihydrofolate synthase/folylpolyglutamate synthase|nr:bifunctional tetrahydrofolate synthase/dihydrofolate synthase [Gammaproteobacteria bacterium]
MDTKRASLQQWLEYIEQAHPKTIDLGLNRITEVGSRGSLLNFTVPVVTVAGTNGKGSTVATLAKLLLAAGKRVGTYTSPHLYHFSERIQINGQCLQDEQLCEAFTQIEVLREKTQLTFFEFTTLAAFSIFQKHKLGLDIIILEVGLGGRQDAVNVINPDLAIITSIGYDHQEYLGQTLDSIAYEKAGILREGIPVILSHEAQMASLLEQTETLHNTLYVEAKDFEYNNDEWRFGEKVVKLTNIYLPPNSVSLAMAAYTILGERFFSLAELNMIAPDLEKIMMKGRFEQVIVNKTLIIFDVAHNPQGAKWLASKVKSLFCQGKIYAVWSSLADKDLSGIIEPLKEIVDVWCVGAICQTRAATKESLCKTLTQNKVSEVCAFPTITKAFHSTMEMVQAEDIVVVFGSFYAVSEVMESLSSFEREFQNNGLYKVDSRPSDANSFAISGVTWKS